jgi:hypothetical protein
MTPSPPSLNITYLVVLDPDILCAPLLQSSHHRHFTYHIVLKKLAMGIFGLALFVTQPHDKSLAST